MAIKNHLITIVCSNWLELIFKLDGEINRLGLEISNLFIILDFSFKFYLNKN